MIVTVPLAVALADSVMLAPAIDRAIVVPAGNSRSRYAQPDGKAGRAADARDRRRPVRERAGKCGDARVIDGVADDAARQDRRADGQSRAAAVIVPDGRGRSCNRPCPIRHGDRLDAAALQEISDERAVREPALAYPTEAQVGAPTIPTFR